MKNAVFTVDIARCTGCYACSVACKDRAGLPDELDYLRVEKHESGLYPDPEMYYRVMHCFHCKSPSCARVCPAEAFSKTENGLIKLDGEKCDGCGDCKEACPFDSIVELPGGKFKKCDGCYDEVVQGLDPTCVRSCPCVHWGIKQLMKLS